MDERFHFHSRRRDRTKRVQEAQHAVIALLLVVTAIGHLREHAVTLLPLLEIAAGLFLIGSLVRERLRHHEDHRGIALAEIAAAVMGYVEAYGKTHERHHTSFLVLSFVVPTVVLLVAILEVRTGAYRHFGATDEALVVRGHWLLPRRRHRWDAIESYRVDGDALVLAGARKQRVSLRDVRERDEALAWLRAQFAQRNINER